MPGARQRRFSTAHIPNPLSFNFRSGQHRRAEQIVGRRMLDALLADRSRIHAELASTATEAITRLHEAAVIDETVADLVKARRVDHAHTLAVAESDVAELDDLYKIRQPIPHTTRRPLEYGLVRLRHLVEPMGHIRRAMNPHGVVFRSTSLPGFR